MIQEWYRIPLAKNEMKWYPPPLSKNDIALAKNEIHLIKTPGKMQIAVQAFAWLLSYKW